MTNLGLKATIFVFYGFSKYTISYESITIENTFNVKKFKFIHIIYKFCSKAINLSITLYLATRIELQCQ